MSGVWFIVCIPTSSFERHLLSKDEPSSEKKSSVKISIEHEEGEKEETSHEKTTHRKIGQSEDEDKTLEEKLRECLNELAIFDSVWVESEDKKMQQVFFPCEGPGVECDYVLQMLTDRGIGIKGLSSCGYVLCDVFYRDYGEGMVSELASKDEEISPGESLDKARKQNEFLKSVTARLTVAQVVEKVRADSVVSFDYLLFVFLASMIAAFGLLENNSVNIVAAMLVSPIMGPIMAFTFGIVIKDRSLMKNALIAELAGITMCILCGFIIGLVSGSFRYKASQMPTNEMQGRGTWYSLAVGFFVAMPSGAGVALSILKGNSSSLVGVAISAALLPPTVNCGLMIGIGVMKRILSTFETSTVLYSFGGKNYTLKPSLVPYGKDYEVTWYVETDKECTVLGMMSLMLTLMNIACIIVSALGILKIKEVAPQTHEPAFKRFWTEDVKLVRDYNQKHAPEETDELGKQILTEWADLQGLDKTKVLKTDTEEDQIGAYQTLMGIVEEAAEDDVFQNISVSAPAPPEQMNRRLSVLPASLQGRQESTRLRRQSMAVQKMQMRQKSICPSMMLGSITEGKAAGPSIFRPKPSGAPKIGVPGAAAKGGTPPAEVLKAAQRRRKSFMPI